MARSVTPRFSRRSVIKVGVSSAAGLAFGRAVRVVAQDAAELPLIRKRIPSSGELLPAVGLGTNAYGVTAAEDLADRREVLRRLPQLGGSVVDTAPAYGRSEEVIGNLVSELGIRDKLFIATKVTAPNDDVKAGTAMLEESLRRLAVDRLELMQVHNLLGTDAIMPVLQDWKKAGKVRYVGITTSNAAQYSQMLELMRRHPLDFIQVDYSIANRGAAEQVLPLAAERGMAVLVNMPFGGRRGGNLFGQLRGRELPGWADELDAQSWGQFLLKYVISHPAVTCAIPGTTKVSHLEDNQRGARGRLPDAALRRRMEEYWDSVT